jgi:hypothetical protein
MTLISSGLHTGIDSHDLARAVLALQSVANPSPATVINTAQGLPAYAANPGVKGFFDAFRIHPDPDNAAMTKIEAQLPYSPRIYAGHRDLRKAIQPLNSKLQSSFVSTVTSPAISPETALLEQYCYDRAIALKATAAPANPVTIKPMADPLTGRCYIQISCSLSGTPDSLLADFSSGGGYA